MGYAESQRLRTLSIRYVRQKRYHSVDLQQTRVLEARYIVLHHSLPVYLLVAGRTQRNQIAHPLVSHTIIRFVVHDIARLATGATLKVITLSNFLRLLLPL